MAKFATLPVKDGQVRAAFNGLLRSLLENGVVEALLVPLLHPAGNNVVQTLVTDPAYLERADVLAPVFPVNAARIAQAMTRLAPASRKTALVLRPCELRALVELVKLRQVQLENLYLIGFDCPGAYSVTHFTEWAAAGGTSDAFLKEAASSQWQDENLRAGCQICEFPYPLVSDLTIGLQGIDTAGQLLLVAGTEKGEELLEGLEIATGDSSPLAEARDSAIADFNKLMSERRQKFFEQTRKEVGGPEKLAEVFGPCIKCQNCRVACPVCYCRECFFVSPTFDLEADRYLRMAEKRGAMRMPTDTLLFHLTRMTHMAASCIGCGACEEVCPNDIPLLKIFQMVGSNVQKLFEYVPGRDLEEPLPPTVFREEELQTIGEK